MSRLLCSGLCPFYWTCRQLVEAVERRFTVAVSVEAMRKRVRKLGYCWKRTRYVPCKELDPALEHEHRARLGDVEKGAEEGRLALLYLGVVGFSLALPVS